MVATVALVKREAGRESLRQALELCEGFAPLKSSDTVLIKPNVVWGGEGGVPPSGW